MSVEDKLILEITRCLEEILRIAEAYLAEISKACAPHTLPELIAKLMPRMVYATGGPKDWYDFIEEGEGLHGEKLNTISEDDCRLLDRLQWNLSEKLNRFFDQVGVGSIVRSADAAFSFTDKKRLELEQEIVRELKSVETISQDILAQTQGYSDRTRQDGAIHPLRYQIRSVYELRNVSSALKELINRYVLLGIKKPELTIQKNMVIDRLERIGIADKVVPYIHEAESLLTRNDFDGCCVEARKALEATACILADLITGRTARRNFQEAINIFRDHQLLPADTAEALKARSVGIYGWLSVKGGHPEETSGGTLAKDYSEARYAINWTYATIILLLDVYLNYIPTK